MPNQSTTPDITKLAALLKRLGDRGSLAFQFNDRYWRPIAEALVAAGWHHNDDDDEAAEAVTEYALDYGAGYCCISEDLADAEEMAQFVIDGKFVRRTVIRGEWMIFDEARGVLDA